MNSADPAAIPALFRRSNALDLLRAAAMLLVIGRHLVPHLERFGTAPEPFRSMLALWHSVGWLGVDLFFVLSGYLISGLLFSEFKATGRIDVGRFLARRGMKIYPAYYVFLLYGVLRAAAGVATTESSMADFGRFLSDLAPCLILVQNYADRFPFGHTWSLAVEEHFYLTLPFAIAWLGRKQRLTSIVWIGLGVILALPLARSFAALQPQIDAGRVYSLTHFRLDSLLLGVLFRYLTLSGTLPKILPARYTPFLLMGGAAPFLLPAFLHWDHPFILGPGLTLISFGSVALIWCALNVDANRNGRAPLWLGVCAWIGRNSYSTYLWHVTVMGWAIQGAAKVLPHLGMPSWLQLTTVVVGATAAVIFVGALMTHLVEAPFLRLRDRWVPPRAGLTSNSRDRAVAIT